MFHVLFTSTMNSVAARPMLHHQNDGEAPVTRDEAIDHIWETVKFWPAATVQVVEYDLTEGWARDVTEDILRDMADSVDDWSRQPAIFDQACIVEYVGERIWECATDEQREDLALGI